MYPFVPCTIMAILPESFEVSEFVQVTWKWDLPKDFGATLPYFVLGFNMALSAVYSGAESTLVTYLYRVLDKNNAGGTFTEVNETLNSSDAIDVLTTGVVRTRLVIPNSELTGSEEGLIECAFSTGSGSTGPSLMIGDVKGGLVFGPQGSVPSGFSFP